MRLDSTQLTAFQKCPRAWQEQFVSRLSKPMPYLAYGQFFHALLEEHYCGKVADPLASGLWEYQKEVEEARATLEAYRAAYPIEPFEVLECERRFCLPLGRHELLGKIDGLVRDKQTGRLQVLETKTEARGSKRNLPEAWLARMQGSIYCYAASELLQEPCDTVILNIVIKASPAKQIGPTFRRDSLYRSPEQLEEALRDIHWAADAMESISQAAVPAPRFTNSCVSDMGYKCSYFDLCHIGRTPELLATFIETEDYLKET